VTNEVVEVKINRKVVGKTFKKSSKLVMKYLMEELTDDVKT